MRTLRRIRDTRRSDRGALVVEFALFAPVVIMLLLGTVTMGLKYNRQISLNDSARETARYAATSPVEDSLVDWLNDVADVAKDAASGDLASTAPDQEICVAFISPGGSDENDRTIALFESEGSRSLLAGAECFDDGLDDGGRRVQVRVERSSQVTAGVYTADGTVTAQSVARYERD